MTNRDPRDTMVIITLGTLFILCCVLWIVYTR